jgi:hypothetical protein
VAADVTKSEVALPDDDAAVGVFGDLRPALLAQRAAVAERLLALDEAEAALARMRDVFGLAAAPKTTPKTAREAPGRRAGGAQRACQECGKPFEPRQGGQPHIYCSTRCRKLAHVRQRPPRQPNGRAPADASKRAPVVEPVPDKVERPFYVPAEQHVAGEAAEALQPPRLPWEPRA